MLFICVQEALSPSHLEGLVFFLLRSKYISLIIEITQRQFGVLQMLET